MKRLQVWLSAVLLAALAFVPARPLPAGLLLSNEWRLDRFVSGELEPADGDRLDFSDRKSALLQEARKSLDLSSGDSWEIAATGHDTSFSDLLAGGNPSGVSGSGRGSGASSGGRGNGSGSSANGTGRSGRQSSSGGNPSSVVTGGLPPADVATASNAETVSDTNPGNSGNTASQTVAPAKEPPTPETPVAVILPPAPTLVGGGNTPEIVDGSPEPSPGTILLPAVFPPASGPAAVPATVSLPVLTDDAVTLGERPLVRAVVPLHMNSEPGGMTLLLAAAVSGGLFQYRRGSRRRAQAG